MALGEVTANSSELVPVLVSELGQLAIWLQAIGAIAFLWLVFQVINLRINLKRRKELKILNDNLERLEKKLDSLEKKKR